MIAQKQKRELLAHLVKQNEWEQVLVFTRTKHGANKLAEYLGKQGIGAAAIHGNKSQSARTKALSQFKEGALPVLVATDIAARGLDIEQLPQVVNFELPNIAEDYVHRIGRTGRAGSTGHAISLVDSEETGHLAGIERLIKRRIDRATATDFVPAPPSAETAADNQPRRQAPRGGQPQNRGPRSAQPRRDQPRRPTRDTRSGNDAPRRAEPAQRADGEPNGNVAPSSRPDVDGNRIETRRPDARGNAAPRSGNGNARSGRGQPAALFTPRRDGRKP